MHMHMHMHMHMMRMHMHMCMCIWRQCSPVAHAVGAGALGRSTRRQSSQSPTRCGRQGTSASQPGQALFASTGFALTKVRNASIGMVLVVESRMVPRRAVNPTTFFR